MNLPGSPSRAARISPDRPAVAVAAISLVGTIMLASYVFSFAAIADAAAWTGAPPWARWLAPVFIDGAIVTYTASLAILRWRGEPVGRTLFFLGTFTGISVAVNFAHAGAAQGWDFGRVETWFACLIGVAAPLAALFAAEEATRLVFTRDDPGAGASEAVDTVVAAPDGRSAPVGDDDDHGSAAIPPVGSGWLVDPTNGYLVPEEEMSR